MISIMMMIPFKLSRLLSKKNNNNWKKKKKKKKGKKAFLKAP
jgi:hypothetical protein